MALDRDRLATQVSTLEASMDQLKTESNQVCLTEKTCFFFVLPHVYTHRFTYLLNHVENQTQMVLPMMLDLLVYFNTMSTVRNMTVRYLCDFACS